MTDTPLDLSRDIENLTIVLTRVPTEVRGTVMDAEGRPARDYVVVLFAEDPRQWTRHTRFLGIGRPDQHGAYVVAGLPAGAYRAVALDFLEAGRQHDPALLEQLRAVATPVIVRDGASTSLDLRLLE